MTASDKKPAPLLLFAVAPPMSSPNGSMKLTPEPEAVSSTPSTSAIVVASGSRITTVSNAPTVNNSFR